MYRIIILLFIVLPYGLKAQHKKLDAAIARHIDEAVEMRETIHANPELSNREFETAKMVASYLKKCGIEVQTQVAHTGVVGILKGKKDGPVVALRADMDALPIKEDTDLPFISTKKAKYNGKMVPVAHACGHDIHTSVLLGTAAVLADMRNELKGTVKFIFQPAEEGAPSGENGGAKMMIQEGVLEHPKPDVIFGLHTLPEMEVGKIGYVMGPGFAAVNSLNIKIKGLQAHGARPHQSVDPIVVASEVVLALQTIRSRQLNPTEASVITIGMIHGGVRRNIIPGEVDLKGTVRTYNPDLRKDIEHRIERLLKGITSAYGADYEMKFYYGSPALQNDIELTKQMIPTFERVLGEENAIEIPPTTASEDFARYAEKIPAIFYRLGTLKPGTVSGGLHATNFRADNSSVEVGIRTMSNLVMDYLEGR
ncbi:amidohydrolase [Puteibacter caeruleilacunae]|nr:amidohydrolase [Puteibacter caeruleilacunae]